ncbi:thioredoxin domain-containing protein [Streptomyces sp. NPDC054962]
MEELPETLGEDGTTVMVGDPAAGVKVHLYEDPRCPFCEEFETTGGGPQLRKAMLDRKAGAAYTLASFLDDRVGGTGSKKAVNALRAALEEYKFAEYHEVLYATSPRKASTATPTPTSWNWPARWWDCAVPRSTRP